MTSELFPPIDKIKIKKELAIESNARSDGEKNSPSSDANNYSPTENSIKATLVGYQKQYLDYYNALVHTYKTQYKEAQNDLNFELIRNHEEARVDEVLQEKTRIDGELSHISNELKASAKELLKYRTDHNLLNRSPETKSIYNALTILVSVFFVELFTTIYLTREAGSLDTVVAIIVLYCLLNCGLPYLSARFVKYSNYHTNLSGYAIKKVIGYLIGISLVVFLFLLNLGMGHYRSAGLTFTATDTDTVIGILNNFQRQSELIFNAWSNFIESPFGIREIPSWLLVLVGYFLAMMSLYKGMVDDDIYPKYGKLTKKYKRIYREYQNILEDFSNEINDKREEVVADIEESKIKFGEAMASIPRIESDANTTFQAYNHAQQKISEDFSELISVYQHINKQERTTSAPQYFNDNRSLDFPSIERYTPERIDQDINENDIYKFIDDCAKNVHTKIDDITQSIPSADLVIADIGYPLIIE